MSDSAKKPFSPNRSIDTSIREMLPRFSFESQRRMVKAIRDAGRAAEKQQDENTDSAARHIFREFIPAALLNSFGYGFEYNCKLDGLTPDWYDSNSKFMMDSYTFERGGRSEFAKRVRSAIDRKCEKYCDLTKRLSSRFIVAVYLDFVTGIELNDCLTALPLFRDTFERNSTLWGIIFFTEGPGLAVLTQPYGFLCITADDSYREEERWRFRTASALD